jgi:hypothetical protein
MTSTNFEVRPRHAERPRHLCGGCRCCCCCCCCCCGGWAEPGSEGRVPTLVTNLERRGGCCCCWAESASPGAGPRRVAVVTCCHSTCTDVTEGLMCQEHRCWVCLLAASEGDANNTIVRRACHDQYRLC